MRKIKFLYILLIVFTISLFTTGCSKDEMEDIKIIVTNYPNEYITSRLYATHAKISSIYPDGVNPNEYKLKNKQKKEFSKIKAEQKKKMEKRKAKFKKKMEKEGKTFKQREDFPPSSFNE